MCVCVCVHCVCSRGVGEESNMILLYLVTMVGSSGIYHIIYSVHLFSYHGLASLSTVKKRKKKRAWFLRLTAGALNCWSVGVLTFLISTTSPTVWSGLKQTGSVMKPFLYFLTLLTSLACSSMERFEWMMPIPERFRDCR